MLRNIFRLAPQTGAVPQGERSIFAYLKRTGTEIAATSNPTDLESLVRVVTAIESFKYPAFNPAIQDLVSMEGRDEWVQRIQEEIKNVPQGTALKYFKILAHADIPSELLLTLIKRVNIQSRSDLNDFIEAVAGLSSNQITPEVRRATTYVINKAVFNNCKLGTYNAIFDLLNQVWQSSRRHLVPTKLRTQLVDAAWSAFLRLDMSGKDSEFVDAVKWLSLGEPVSGRKTEIDEMLAKIEARSKSHIRPELIPGLLSNILGYRRNVIPEPLDSIAQLLVRKLTVSKLSLSELEQLVSGMRRFFNTRTKAPQLESIVASFLPRLLGALERNISNLPSRSMPAVLELLVRSGDSTLVMQELERRGHEMAGPELVRLINSMDWVETSILKNLFSAKLAEAKYVDGLLACLSYTEKVEFLATLGISGLDMDSPDVSILITSLRDQIRNEAAEEAKKFETSTLVRMAAAGDAVFSNTGLVPSELVKKFLESIESSSLTVHDSLRLLSSDLAKNDKAIAKSLFAHVQGEALDVAESIDLLRASLTSIQDKSYVEDAMKNLIPQMRQIRNSLEVLEVLRLLPSELAAWSVSGPKYSPSSQFREEILNRVLNVSDEMDARTVASTLIELARLGFACDKVVAGVVKRGLSVPGRIAETTDETVDLVRSCRRLGVYSSDFLDMIVRDFFQSERGISVTALVNLASSLTDIGNKNETVMIAIEQLLRRQGESLDISSRISLLNSMAKNGIFSPLFVDQFKLIFDEASQNISALSDEDWNKLFEAHLAVLVEAPPKIKVRFANDTKMKNFVDENCAFSWYASQEKARNQFIYSQHRWQIAKAMEELGWDSMRVPELGKEVYHVDFVGDKVAVVTVPECDELRLIDPSQQGETNSVRIIVGQSMTKIKHLQYFGYKVVPVWLKEWSEIDSDDERKKCLVRNSTQVVFALGTRS